MQFVESRIASRDAGDAVLSARPTIATTRVDWAQPYDLDLFISMFDAYSIVR